MTECIFCKIINNEIPSKTIYEDNIMKVIMNINPTTNGHLLILPKTHYDNIFDADEKFLLESIKVIREKLYPLLKDKLNCEGLTISENNFLGQEIKHLHIHITPRYQNDLLDYNYNKEQLLPLDDIYNKLIDTKK